MEMSSLSKPTLIHYQQSDPLNGRVRVIRRHQVYDAVIIEVSASRNKDSNPQQQVG
jgi:hypothetical protein